jgi:AcrR family transcriptional regulator
MEAMNKRIIGSSSGENVMVQLEPRQTLKAAAQQAARTEIFLSALRLFSANGFDETTVDEIAAAVGISKRTFFRYFPSKESVIFEHYRFRKIEIISRIETRPLGESDWDLLRNAFGVFVEIMEDPERSGREIEVESVIQKSILLRGVQLRTVQDFHEGLTEALMRRTQNCSSSRSQERTVTSALVGAALGCVEAAYHHVVSEGRPDKTRAVLDHVMESLRPCSSVTSVSK